jgi:trehalose-phosphatase
MPESFSLKLICRHLANEGHLTLFLDYEGTLLHGGRSPEPVAPDRELLDLLASLARLPNIHTTLFSERSLASLRRLFPVPRLTLAGIYGVEIHHEGMLMLRGATPNESRPVISRVIQCWAALARDNEELAVEDKGQAAVLHVRRAPGVARDSVMETARDTAAELIVGTGFQILSGAGFVEVLPVTANKGQTLDWLLDAGRPARDLAVYFGDDASDYGAFAAVSRWGGIAIGVGEHAATAHTSEHVSSPQEAREWLRDMAAAAQAKRF